MMNTKTKNRLDKIGWVVLYTATLYFMFHVMGWALLGDNYMEVIERFLR